MHGLGLAAALRTRWSRGPASHGLEYRPELDGLRAIAILLVMIDHLGWTAVAYGLVGVTVFFTLSGYLITSLLLAERAGGGIDFRNFYFRRIVRLGPALVALLAVVSILGLAGVWPDSWVAGVVASLSYVANWIKMFNIDLQPLGHTWSLAIEEQFYALWPLILAFVPPRILIPLATGGMIWGSAAYNHGLDLAGYFSIFTNGSAILAGCLAALVGVRLPSLAGSLGVAVIIVSAVFTSQAGAIIGASLVIASPSLALAPLAALGKRAYGIYLWSWPCGFLVPGLLGQIVAVGCAEVSYRLLERPLIDRYRERLRPRTRPASPSSSDGPPPRRSTSLPPLALPRRPLSPPARP